MTGERPADGHATLTIAGVVRGARVGAPMLPSGFVYGLAFGTLASGMGLSTLEAVIMSAAVFSGTAQVAVLQVWPTLAGVLPAFLIVAVANLRYVLMGASLRPWLGTLPPVRAGLPLLFMVDGAYAIAMRARAGGDHDAGVMLGASLMSFAGWVVATALGYQLGRLLADPRAIGLDFVVVAFCVAAATQMARLSRDLWPALAAGLVVVLLELTVPGPWTLVGGAAAAVLVAGVRARVAAGAAP